jgi:hypothetical protein
MMIGDINPAAFSLALGRLVNTVDKPAAIPICCIGPRKFTFRG